MNFMLVGTNIGHLRIRDITLAEGPRVPASISCTVAGQIYNTNSSVLLEPQGTAMCNGSYTITTEDIEAGTTNLTVVVRGVSSKGDVVGVSRGVLFTPVVHRNYTAKISVEHCNKPKQAGKAAQHTSVTAGLCIGLIHTQRVSKMLSMLQQPVQCSNEHGGAPGNMLAC